MKGVNNTYKENRLDPSTPRWFAVYTKYKTEKYVANLLTKKGIEAYVPLISYTKRWSRKIKHYQTPLINCYVFVKITQQNYLKVLQTEYVLGFLKNRGNLNEVKEEEIEILKKVVGEEVELFNEEIQFSKGKQVEIVSGNLTGLQGILLEQKGKTEFLVELESLGLQLRIIVAKNMLRAVRA